MAQQQPTFDPSKPFTVFDPTKAFTVVEEQKQDAPPKSKGPATIGDYFRAQFPHLAFGADVVTGAAKGVGNTVLGVSELINKGLGTNQNPEVWNRARQDFTTPANTGERLGFGAEQVGEFFLPGGAAKNTATALGKLKAAQAAGRGGQVVARALTEGVAGAGVHAAQTGSTEGAGFVGGAGAAGAAIGGPALNVVGKGVSKLGQRVEGWLINAGKKDLEHGFKIGNIFKHQLGGTVQQTLEKSEAKMKQLGGELRTELGRLGPSGQKPMVDVWGAITAAEKDLTANAAKTTGQNAAIQRALDNLKNEVRALQAQGTGVVTNGVFDLPTANEIKQGIGDFGAWQFGRTDPDANATEIVANAIYSKLRQAVEKAAPNGTRIAELNKQIGEIIPIRQAIMRRIPVTERQRIMGLGEMIGFASGNWWIPMTDRVLRSGPAAQQMVNFGDTLQRQTGRMSGAGSAAGASQIKR